MQVLNLLRYDLPRAFAKDWKQLWCDHKWRRSGTTYSTVKNGPGEWDFMVGKPLASHFYCEKCDKSRRVPCRF
jgi:hypothetical protein